MNGGSFLSLSNSQLFKGYCNRKKSGIQNQIFVRVVVTLNGIHIYSSLISHHQTSNLLNGCPDTFGRQKKLNRGQKMKGIHVPLTPLLMVTMLIMNWITDTFL